MRAIVGAGHALCDHSRDHSRVVGGRDRGVVKAEIKDGRRQIRSVAGEAPVPYYRQPHGAWTPLAVELIADAATGMSDASAPGLPSRRSDDPSYLT